MKPSRAWSVPHPAGVVVLGLALAGCGWRGDAGASASGQALADAPVVGTVTLNDTSRPMQTRSAPTGADGTFSVRVAGLLPPFLLRVEWLDADGPRRLYAAAEGSDDVDVNGLTDLAFGGACAGQDEDAVFWTADAGQQQATAAGVRGQFAALGVALAPLLERYGISDPGRERDAVRLLLEDVGLVRADGVAVVTNRATGAVIFLAQVSDLAGGAFHPEAMPAGPPGSACTAFTYTAFGPCRTDGTQARAVLTASPSGCSGGAPVTTRQCTYLPPAPTCTAFTYTAFGPCQPDGTRARAVLTSSPAGCTGGAPATVQACTYLPPIDGAALYTRYCAGCHGSAKKGSSVRSIQRAIERNTGGMRVLDGLSAEQIAAISAAP